KVVLRVSIPPGAAILPTATDNLRDTDPVGPLDLGGVPENAVLLPPNTLGRITVTKAYTRKLGYWKSRRTNRALASFAGGVPQQGTPGVVAPWWAWSDAELDEYFIANSERIPAGWWFHDRGPVRAAQEALAAYEEADRVMRQAQRAFTALPTGHA